MTGAKDEIFEIAKRLAKEDAEKTGTGGWEAIQDLAHFKLITDGDSYLIAAILEYLDKPLTGADKEIK